LNALLVGLNAKYIHSALGLYSIAENCRIQGIHVEVREYTINQELLYVLADITGQAPDVVGIACYIWNREMVMKLATALKKALPGLIVVLGGPEVSPEAVEVLTYNPSVDFVVQGEGEQSTAELFGQLAFMDRCVLSNKESSTIATGLATIRIPGVAGRYCGSIELNGGVRLVEDLDSLPFPYQSAMMAGLSNRIIYYEATRGCPYSCSYCVSATTKGVRRRSVEKVKAEVQFFLQHQVRQVKFVDRTFNVIPDHYHDIWRFLAAQPGLTNFHFEIVADRLCRDEIEWLVTLPEGLFQFEIGVQSTYAQTLEAIGRHNAWDPLRKNVTELMRAGNIHLHLDLIVGLPFEGWGEFQKSFNEVYAMKPDMLQIGFLKLLPGTPLRSEAVKFGYVSLEHPPYEILSNQFIAYKEVRRLKQLEEVFNQTYNNGKFANSLAYMTKKIYQGDAFSLYVDLSEWWEAHGLLGMAHSPDNILSYIYKFGERFSSSQRAGYDELLKYDAILDRGRAIKGESLNWNRQRWEQEKSNFWRKEDSVRRYFTNYRFSNWREVKKNYPIEVFDLDICRWLVHEEEPGGERIVLLFDLTGTKPKLQVIDQADFWVGEKT
jgi:radical SAM superfamily enzyme YgiQ (UPF0313 family)